jgi:hypothetical protein
MRETASVSRVGGLSQYPVRVMPSLRVGAEVFSGDPRTSSTEGGVGSEEVERIAVMKNLLLTFAAIALAAPAFSPLEAREYNHSVVVVPLR